MTYSSGGLIQAADYNGFIGTSDIGNGSTLNQIWGIGTGDCGYGQTGSLITSVGAANTVTAAQWASLINKLNTIRTHQSGSGSGLSAPTAGTTITYLSTLSSAISTAYSSRTSTAYAASSSTGSTKGFTLNAGTGVAASGSVTWTITFPSVDQARYFFNCGGYYRVAFSSATNTGGTARGTSMVTLAQTNYNAKDVKVHTMTARAGTGGIVNQDTTNVGYYELTGSNANYCIITGQSYPYVGDYVYLQAYQAGGAGSYSGNGSTHYVTFGGYSSTTGSSFGVDNINVTLNMNLTVYYPEVTNLTSSWGTVTIA